MADEKSVLDQCSEELHSKIQEIAMISDRYKSLQQLHADLTANPNADLGPDVGMKLTVQGQEFMLTGTDAGNVGTQILSALPDALTQLGQQILVLWGEAHEITSRAKAQCDQAAVAAGVG